MKNIFILLKITVVCMTQAYGQHCTITAYGNGATDTIEICQGEPVTLSATGDCFNYILYNNFNDGTIGTGWGTGNQAMFNNPCPPHSPDSTIYMWMGSTTTIRQIATLDFDVSSGAIIDFEMRFAVSGEASPCNGPEFYNEGLLIQYSLNGGMMWEDIKYYAPNGDSLTYMSTSTTPSVPHGQQTPFTVWNRRIFPIPPAAQTTSTRFRWAQPFSSDSESAHWGLDNVKIIGPPPTTETWWSHGAQGLTPGVVYPTSDTSFTAFITDGVDTVSSSLYVIVHDIPTADFTATSPVCLGELANITYTGTASASANYTWSFDGGSIISGTGQGPYEVLWDSIGTYDVSLNLEENSCLSPVNTVSVDVISCAGIEETMPEYFQIYPNPASDVLIIENKQRIEIMQIKVLNLQGQRLMKKALAVSSSTMLDISSLSQGMYFVVVQGKKHNIVKKIAVQRD